ncbi:MAG: cation transporter [Deltaproteobacteria bacterium]|nr:cation transporter [Deltaproteobacteria bacterium]
MKLQIAIICGCNCDECPECRDKTLRGVAESKEGETTSSGLYKRALFLSYFTVGYNFLEGLVSVIAGLLAGSIALVGFGLDSFIESLSGGVMIWRFSKHARITEEEEERMERKAIGLVGYTFFIFAAYVFYESVKKLYLHEIPDPSLLGIIIAIVSIIVMPILFYMKYRTGKSIGSRSLVVDSKQTLACVFLSFGLLVGLGLNYLYRLWWADPVVGLVIVAYLIKEGYEALKERKLCGC